MDWKVFAEDSGTGLQDQSNRDYGDGAHFGALAHGQNDADYAVVAPSLSADFTVPEVDLGKAQYRLTATNVSERDHDGNGSTVDWPEATFSVTAPSTIISLADSTVNEIYVTVDLTTTGDDGQYVVNTDETKPAEPSLKVAEVDTSNDTVTSVNQHPAGVFAALQATTAPSSDTDVVRKKELDSTDSDVSTNASDISSNDTDISDLQALLSGYDIQKDGTDGSGIINFKSL